MKGNLAAVLAAITLFSMMPAAQAAEPLALQGVMRDLGKHMQTITGAIAYEDWELVARTAPLVAKHPEPSLAEKARIASFMGGNMLKFKGFDMQTHEAAHEMEHAANMENGEQVIAAFQKVQTSCLGCHQAFRASFVEHFYGNK